MKLLLTSFDLQISINQFCDNPYYKRLLIFENDIGFVSLADKTIPVKSNSVVLLCEGVRAKILKADAATYYCFGYSEVIKRQLGKPARLRLNNIENFFQTNDVIQLKSNFMKVFGEHNDDIDYLGISYFHICPDDETCLKVFAGVISQIDGCIFSYSKNKNKYIERLNVLIEHNLNSQHKPAFYAGKLSITEHYLNLLSKKNFGVTIHVFLERLVAQKAHALLLQNKSVKEVCNILHFKDHSHFDKFFKKHFNFSPKLLYKKSTP